MSGIAGVYFLDGKPVSSLILKKMIGSLAHRGPDDSEVWSEGPIGLGQCVLETTPESLFKKSSLIEKIGNLVLLADARIDNRDELIRLLELDIVPTQDLSDGFLILNAYEKWGEECTKRFLGDFAFVIWDRYNRRLFCARDHIGVKPFYFYRSPRSFIFASEIKALLLWDDVPHRLNELRIVDFFLNDYEDKISTFYQDIYRLPPAHSLIVDIEGFHLQSYWFLDPNHEIRFSSDDEYIEAFREIFTEAVRCRLRSKFSVGCALSGGLDSSSIACTVHKLSPQLSQRSLSTFSAVFSGLPEPVLSGVDERKYIDSVLLKGEFKPYFIEMGEVSPLANYPRMLQHLDELYFAPTLAMYWALYDAVNMQKVRVFLDGVDGDATVSHGLEYLTELVHSGKWLAFLSEARAISKTSSTQPSLHKIVWMFGIHPFIPKAILNMGRTLIGRERMQNKAEIVFNKSFARRIGLQERIHDLRSNRSSPKRGAREEHWNSLSSGMIPLALELLDKVAAAHSLEVRYPFFDRRLMEFCLAIPPDQKLANGWTRAILRKSMAGILPEEVRWRTTKADFRPYIHWGLMNFERQTMDKAILSEPQVIEPYVDLANLRPAYQRYLSGVSQSAGDLQLIYSSVIFNLWLRNSSLVP